LPESFWGPTFLGGKYLFRASVSSLIPGGDPNPPTLLSVCSFSRVTLVLIGYNSQHCREAPPPIPRGKVYFPFFCKTCGGFPPPQNNRCLKPKNWQKGTKVFWGTFFFSTSRKPPLQHRARKPKTPWSQSSLGSLTLSPWFTRIPVDSSGGSLRLVWVFFFPQPFPTGSLTMYFFLGETFSSGGPFGVSVWGHVRTITLV